MTRHPAPGLKRRAPSDPRAIREEIRAEAQRLGFDAVGFAAAQAPPEQHDALAAFVHQGWHGDMDWLADDTETRANPARLWPRAGTLIALGMTYTPAHDPLAVLAQRDRAAIAVYAQGRDYHMVVKSRLKALGLWIWNRWGRELKVFVDTAPVMERPAAARAGLGWQGKHTNLVSRTHGSWLFLGEILTTLALPADEPERDHCGTCRACLDICPTGAFPAPGRLDARRCISYLTIEHAGPIPREFRAPIGNRIYGCDDCLAVCPWNKFAQTAREAAFAPRPGTAAPRLTDLAALDDAAFRRLFSGTAIKRSGRDRFVRNVAIALGNSADAQSLPAVRHLLDDTSPLVRGAAVWALMQLSPTAFREERERRRVAESDADVQAEWDAVPGTRKHAS
ncbi:tRNA epoxyqueuosine(34) reductase QueG [Reyranella sp. CPCC 100927]|uniref:tRNA epoxyqueuosine(34) reductase QueG n=1 Tax=Reyranella sp. CPCC 100927 TaxID=2599616 RepID=UPI0011B839CD|nr:tRNA epoxyqueuosine(34) reductase QueG [Reyranella sp. CPCC 100927]TWT05129.1 tRNA epoxyqueuosine(34) reductase QueG [Reyranella sp. CPCC 100927]